MSRTAARESRARKTVSYIEPDGSLVTFMGYLFERAGYDLAKFADVRDFEERNQGVGDMLILETFADPQAGRELIRKIRKHDKRTPIILLTAIGEEEELVKCLSIGASDFVRKPFSTAELLARMKASFRMLDALVQDADSFKDFSTVERMFNLSHRIDVIASSFASLRINSASGSISELRLLSEEIRAAAEKSSNELRKPTLPAVRADTNRTLPILMNLFEQVGTERGAQMLIAGAVSGIMGLGGWTTVSAYALSLAAWMGKDAFVRTASSIMKAKRR